MILTRETIAPCSARAGSIRSRSVPSMRSRTTERDSKGSMWMSDAPSRSACVNSALIRRISGASFWLSSRSSTFGMSCSSRDRSRSCARSSASAAAPASAVL